MNKKLSKTLKNKNLRLTQPRRIIFDILTHSEKALSPREIFEKIKNLSSIPTDQASVYRNLTLFTELNLTHRFQDGRYSVCKQNHEPRHKHLHIIASCNRCGRTREIDKHSSELCKLAKNFKSFVKSFGNFSSLTMEGICENCQSNQPHPG